MTMKVRHSESSLSALNQLGQNNTELAKQLQRVSSGMKINGAYDDASGYAISERMQTQIRGLSQCDSNTSMGKDMTNIAERAVDQQLQILGKMRQIAMKASDGTYSQADRDVLQSETSQLAMELNNISYDTNYNGKQLLCGSSGMGGISTSFNPDSAMNDNTVDNVVPAPNGATSNTRPKYTGYGPISYAKIGNRTMYDATQLVPCTSWPVNTGVLDSSGTPYSVVYDPNNGYRMSVTQNGVMIPIVINGVDSNGNATTGFTPYLHPVKSPVAAGDSVLTSADYPLNAAVTVEKEYTGELILPKWGRLYQYELDFSGVTSSGVAISFPSGLDEQGFTIMCGTCGQFVSIKFDADQTAGIGLYANDLQTGSEAYMVGIKGATTGDAVAAVLFDGLKNISGKSVVTTTTVNGGTNEKLALSWHDVSINKFTDSSGNVSYHITKDGPQLVLYNGFKGNLNVGGGKHPWQDLYIQDDTRGSAYTKLQFPNTTLGILFPSNKSDWVIDPQQEDYPNPWPEELQFISDEDRKFYTEKYHCQNDDEIRKEKWRDEVWPYPRKGAVLSGSCVRTEAKAQKFCEDIDQAIKYILHVNTTLGAQSQRLDAMNSNIVMKGENVQNAESTLRDADVAKEMMGYTKANVLSQSAQSMLAQSNQHLGNVLDLLK